MDELPRYHAYALRPSRRNNVYHPARKYILLYFNTVYCVYNIFAAARSLGMFIRFYTRRKATALAYGLRNPRASQLSGKSIHFHCRAQPRNVYTAARGFGTLLHKSAKYGCSFAVRKSTALADGLGNPRASKPSGKSKPFLCRAQPRNVYTPARGFGTLLHKSAYTMLNFRDNTSEKPSALRTWKEQPFSRSYLQACSYLQAYRFYFVSTLPRKNEAYGTGCSQAVPHPSTIPARRCLTSVIRRERVCSSWYGRRR